MRERAPGVWELIVEAGRDPVTGRRRQVSRIFHGSLRDGKLARAQLDRARGVLAYGFDDTLIADECKAP